MQIDTRHGARIVYGNERDGHVWEALTISDARAARSRQHVTRARRVDDAEWSR